MTKIQNQFKIFKFRILDLFRASCFGFRICGSKGIITTLAMVFGAIFVLLMAGLMGFILLQYRASLQGVAHNQSLHIAEAGLEYYKWRLLHSPNDLQDGTGVPGPYVHDYQDATANAQGTFSLEIEGTTQCGEITSVVITSTGWTDRFPNVPRTVRTSYVKPSVAEFAFLLNDNVWAGADREIKGPYHSNGGIRMDGENKSLVTSAKETWLCTASFGCDPSVTQPGVFTTANGNEELFVFPITPFDFAGITLDLAVMKNLTQPFPQGQGQGLYFTPSSGYGYHVVLNQTNMQVFEVTGVQEIYAYNNEEEWHWEDSRITSETLLGTYAVASSCSVSFFEDTIWLEGELQGKTTIVAADLEDPSKTANVWLLGDIEYQAKDGTHGLLVLSQHDVLISLDSPDSMELQGIFVAQTGRFGRNHYDCARYPDDCIKSDLEMFGSVVSNERVGTKWTYSWGGIASGYMERENIYDPAQTFSPPPFLPTSSLEFELQGWEEVE